MACHMRSQAGRGNSRRPIGGTGVTLLSVLMDKSEATRPKPIPARPKRTFAELLMKHDCSYTASFGLAHCIIDRTRRHQLLAQVQTSQPTPTFPLIQVRTYAAPMAFDYNDIFCMNARNFSDSIHLTFDSIMIPGTTYLNHDLRQSWN